MANIERVAKIAVALAATVTISACSEYLDRKETIFFGAGDAVATNRLAHTTDPWPVYAANTRIVASGERVAGAVRRYQEPPKASSNPSTVINVR